MILTIPRAAALTANQRLHWRAKAERTRDLRTRGRIAWHQSGHAPMDRAHLTEPTLAHTYAAAYPGSPERTTRAAAERDMCRHRQENR